MDELLALAAHRRRPGRGRGHPGRPGLHRDLPAGVDKATGLAVVAERHGVDPADVLVFGDMPNDLPMFAWVPRRRPAVAVANAHPAVRAAADEVTRGHDDDGVAVYLDGYCAEVDV